MPSSTVKRTTVLGYIGLAAHQMARALDASVRSHDFNREEVDALIDVCRSLHKLNQRLKQPKRRKANG